MKPEYLDHIEDILDAMQKISSFVNGIEYDAFIRDHRTSFAVIRGLEIIGEAVKRVPLEVRQEYPQIPWQAMAGMRDKLIHGYDYRDCRGIYIA